MKRNQYRDGAISIEAIRSKYDPQVMKPPRPTYHNHIQVNLDDAQMESLEQLRQESNQSISEVLRDALEMLASEILGH
jgi:Ribbon-helix-helix protein, copG family